MVITISSKDLLKEKQKPKIRKSVALDSELVKNLDRIVQGEDQKKLNLSELTNTCLWQIVNYLKSEEGRKDKNFKIKKEQTKK